MSLNNQINTKKTYYYQHKSRYNFNQRTAFKIIHKFLYNKYTIVSDVYHKIITNQIIYNSKVKIVAVFKDYLIMDENAEFLKRYYFLSETFLKIPKLCDFYIFYSKIFPNYSVLYERKYIYRNIQRKQRMIDIQEEIESKEMKNKQLIESNLSQMFKIEIYNSIYNDVNNEDVIQLFGIINKNKNIQEEELFVNKINGLIHLIENYLINSNNINTITNTNDHYTWRPERGNHIYEKFIKNKTTKIPYNKIHSTQRSTIKKIEQNLFKLKHKHTYSQIINQASSQSYINRNTSISLALSTNLSGSSSLSRLKKIRNIYQKELSKQNILRPNHLRLNKQPINNFQKDIPEIGFPLSPLTDRQSSKVNFQKNLAKTITLVNNNKNELNKNPNDVRIINKYNEKNFGVIQNKSHTFQRSLHKGLNIMKFKQIHQKQENNLILSRNKIEIKPIKPSNHKTLHLSSRNICKNDSLNENKKLLYHNSKSISPKKLLSSHIKIKDMKGIPLPNFSKLFNISCSKFKHKKKGSIK
jgi:hypothetical protein